MFSLTKIEILNEAYSSRDLLNFNLGKYYTTKKSGPKVSTCLNLKCIIRPWNILSWRSTSHRYKIQDTEEIISICIFQHGLRYWNIVNVRIRHIRWNKIIFIGLLFSIAIVVNNSNFVVTKCIYFLRFRLFSPSQLFPPNPDGLVRFG